VKRIKSKKPLLVGRGYARRWDKNFLFGRKRLWFSGLDGFQQDGPDFCFWFFRIGWITGFSFLDLNLFFTGIGWFVHTKIKYPNTLNRSPSLKRAVFSAKTAKKGLRKRANALIIS
jgi:hypothetical protein